MTCEADSDKFPSSRSGHGPSEDGIEGAWGVVEMEECLGNEAFSIYAWYLERIEHSALASENPEHLVLQP